MKKGNALSNALRNSGATVAASPVSPEKGEEPDAPAKAAPKVQASRVGMKPITVFYPGNVRQQLKVLAAEQDRDVDDLVAEALNLLFALYRKPEITPRKERK